MTLAQILWEKCVSEDPDREALGKGPLLKPVAAALRTRALSPVAKPNAQAAVAGGHWIQQELFDRNMLPEEVLDTIANMCLACGQAPGTAHHRLYMCPAMESQRRQVADPSFLHLAAQQSSS